MSTGGSSGYAECACFGLPHDRLGEELAVAVYPKPGHALDADDLRRHVAAHLAAFKVPSQVFVFAAPLPRNASGKLLRRALRDLCLRLGSASP